MTWKKTHKRIRFIKWSWTCAGAHPRGFDNPPWGLILLHVGLAKTFVPDSKSIKASTPSLHQRMSHLTPSCQRVFCGSYAPTRAPETSSKRMSESPTLLQRA